MVKNCRIQFATYNGVKKGIAVQDTSGRRKLLRYA